MKEFLDRLYYMCLPVIVMTLASLGGMTRYVRAAMIESLGMDCIRTARAKGLKVLVAQIQDKETGPNQYGEKNDEENA